MHAHLNMVFSLIRSLTKAEKRYFRLYSNLQNGDKIYLFLFDLCEQSPSPENVCSLFRAKQKEAKLDMATKYLYKTVMDCLLRLREKQDIQTEIFNHITKASILFERELWKEAFRELKKGKRLAINFENDTLLLLIQRTELKYLSALDFEGLSERQLVNKQMKMNETMKHARNINQHIQLYDILKHRIIYRGSVRSEKQKENLNDLVLSELHLIANSSYSGFEARKLHLLFQASYYLHAGNYKSAIRYYQELILLFDTHKPMMQHPPVYYLSAVEGILNSLHTAGLYKEMPFFLLKLKEIEQGDYSSEFITNVQAIHYLFEFVRLHYTASSDEVEKWMHANEDRLFKRITSVGLNLQLRIYLQTVVFYMTGKNYQQAKKHIKKIFLSDNLFYSLPAYKIVRLVNLLLQAELGNYDFFENEITSIKRNMQFEKQTYRTEKLVFKFVKAYPLPSYERSRNQLWLKYKEELDLIRQNKYENQILKMFDFTAWMESKLTGKSFMEILRDRI